MMTSNTERRMSFICGLFFTVFIQAYGTLPSPAASALPQFDGIFRASGSKGVEEAYLEKLFRSSCAANFLKRRNGDLLCF
jgi:hypothetical protein